MIELLRSLVTSGDLKFRYEFCTASCLPNAHTNPKNGVRKAKINRRFQCLPVCLRFFFNFFNIRRIWIFYELNDRLHLQLYTFLWSCAYCMLFMFCWIAWLLFILLFCLRFGFAVADSFVLPPLTDCAPVFVCVCAHACRLCVCAKGRYRNYSIAYFEPSQKHRLSLSIFLFLVSASCLIFQNWWFSVYYYISGRLPNINASVRPATVA